jgi:phospholipase/carboxylesterase
MAASARRPILLVFLHGVGADAASFTSVARAIVAGLPGVELVVPNGFHAFDGGGAGRQWFSIRGVTEQNRPARVRAAGEEVSSWVDAELAHRAWPRERVGFVGFSQGAIVAAWLAVHRRPSPAAVVVMSGRFADDAPQKAGAVSTPVFLAHGARDGVVPASFVGPSALALEAWGARVSTRVYPELGHEVDARELQDVRAFLARELA